MPFNKGLSEEILLMSETAESSSTDFFQGADFEDEESCSLKNSFYFLLTPSGN